MSSPSFWRGRKVFVTGHTGFKGSWLALWLARLGAKQSGLALDPPTEPNLYGLLGLADAFELDVRADLRDASAVADAFRVASPEIVFHLAAQPLVRRSYADPTETYATNVMGTVNVLEAVRRTPSVRAVVVITTDKCYENREWVYPYREDDALGGHDPYSASKACAEIVTASYRSSFFSGDGAARIASARAGNVIGGGDWAADRLIPDCVRSFSSGEPVRLRYPEAVRPWQHVLEPLSGYLLLAERLLAEGGERFAGAWNFGPDHQGDATVLKVTERVAAALDGRVEVAASSDNPHEAQTLRLDSSRARSLLQWAPRWSLDRALAETSDWYREWRRGDSVRAFSEAQITAYERVPEAF